MSQSSKRNAEEAFRAENAESAKKRKRSRRGKSTNVEKTVVHASTTLTPANTKLNNAAGSPADVAILTVSPSKSKRAKNFSDDSRNQSSSKPKSLRQESPKISRKQSKAKSKTSNAAPVSREVVLANSNEISNKQNARSKDGWNLSKVVGGAFIYQDPVLTADGEHLILLTRRSVHIYATTTSLLVRSITPENISSITTCCLSTSSPDIMFVGSNNGAVVSYDWSTGRKIGQWQLGSRVSQLAHVDRDKGHDTLLAILSAEDSRHRLLRISLIPDNSSAQTTELLQKGSLQNFIGYSPDLSVLVVVSKDLIHIGSKATENAKQPYIWRHVTTKGRASACDVSFSKHVKDGHLVVDVVLGHHNGVIMVYKDLLEKISMAEKNVKHAALGNRLHWHRTSVRSVKWSRDGNYLISGGDESVLVIWQLDTNQRQYLPHLSTSILNITVSQAGAHYAIRLCDNSVMILSTSDLLPSTNIAGISLSTNRPVSDTVLLHPSEPHKLLLAASSRSVGGSARVEAAHLQTYDIDNNIQLSKQALTRNLITTVNAGPQGQLLHEPNVVHMQISGDAKWLATIDEWAPDPTATLPMYIGEDDLKDGARETALRFWSWRADGGSWDLVTRIDNPHAHEYPVPLALAANPSSLEFATLGADGCVRIWKPKARLRDGVVVKDKSGAPLYNWSCSRVMEIETTVTEEQRSQESHGTICYSNDGSVLATCWSASSTGYVHFLDPKTGHISHSEPNLVRAPHTRLGFCGRYLVALSDSLIVFDVITSQIISELQLGTDLVADKSERNNFLATNPQINTFAVAVNKLGETGKHEGIISVFEVENCDQGPKDEKVVPGHIRALLADPVKQDFVVLDNEAGVRRLTSPNVTASLSSAVALLSAPASEVLAARKGIEDIFGSSQIVAGGVNGARQKMLEGTEQATAQNLDDLLKQSTGTARLGVREMFERVAHAVSGIRVNA